MSYDVIVIGAGACGLMSGVVSARAGKKVLILEKLPKIAQKLKASGGGRCNITNTLPKDEFMSNFGKDGKFLRDMLELFDSKDLISFLSGIGVETSALDGFRVFPKSHKSTTIIDAFSKELDRLGVEVLCNMQVIEVLTKENEVTGVKTKSDIFYANKVIIATGGMGYDMLGTTGDGYEFAKKLGHSVTNLYPAMLPLKTKESWTKNLTADTLAKVTLKVAMKKHKRLKATGDLIFTKDGIRGPVVLDFAREITPLLREYKEVPILVNISKGLDEDKIFTYFKNSAKDLDVIDVLSLLFPKSLSYQLTKLADVDGSMRYLKLDGKSKERLIKLCVNLPLTIIDDYGFKKAMVTRGGINLKEVDSKTMQSKIVKNLYFCGEVLNIDGPCGGYNLQYCFSSGYVSGLLK